MFDKTIIQDLLNRLTYFLIRDRRVKMVYFEKDELQMLFDCNCIVRKLKSQQQPSEMYTTIDRIFNHIVGLKFALNDISCLGLRMSYRQDYCYLHIFKYIPCIKNYKYPHISPPTRPVYESFADYYLTHDEYNEFVRLVRSFRHYF